MFPCAGLRNRSEEDNILDRRVLLWLLFVLVGY